MNEDTRKKSFYREWIEPFLIAAVIALFIRQFIVEAFKIPSGSMIPTLTVGDHLLVNKFVYGPRIPFTDRRLFAWQQPGRGDIIVFRYPQDEDKNFIKRVVGIPGDKVQIRNGTLFINEQPVNITPVASHPDSKGSTGFNEPRVYDELLGQRVHRIQYYADQADRQFGPRTVPDGHLFVMGDNRDNSQDSRVWGFVRQEKVLGKAFIIYWSWDGDDHWVRWRRIGSIIH